MSDYDYETSWTFRKPNHFWTFLNKQMNLSDLGNDYKLLFFSSMPDDLNDAINSNGCLNLNYSGLSQINNNYIDNVTFGLAKELFDDGENGFRLYLDSNSSTIITVNTPFYLKGVVLVKSNGANTGTNYVVAYSRLSSHFYCDRNIILPAQSEFVGHNSCKGV